MSALRFRIRVLESEYAPACVYFAKARTLLGAKREAGRFAERVFRGQGRVEVYDANDNGDAAPLYVVRP